VKLLNSISYILLTLMEMLYFLVTGIHFWSVFFQDKFQWHEQSGNGSTTLFLVIAHWYEKTIYFICLWSSSSDNYEKVNF